MRRARQTVGTALDNVFKVLLACILSAAVAACTNNPYPDAESGDKVLYTSFNDAPRTLDPAVAYTTSASVITTNVFDTLLEYHYVERPFRLVAGLAADVPEAERRADGGTVYRFSLREGITFHDDPCFPPNSALGGRRSRVVSSDDVAFQMMRIADPAIISPVRSFFAKVRGFAAFSKRLAEKRKADADFAKQPVHEQYAAVGPVAGLATPDASTFELILDQPDPQILYWFAMPFTTPLPHEAVAYYDGDEGRDRLADHPVGTGPFKLTRYDKQFRFTLTRNRHWYGKAHPQAPGVAFPENVAARDIKSGTIDRSYLGRRMPFLERVEFYREREAIPRFNKFMQGYYDNGGIIKESFDSVIDNDRLSPRMAERGMRLDKSVEPSIFYIGFNMDDPQVGRSGGMRSRKLRQAMSLVIDTERYLELFHNKRGVAAQSPLPPGLFGYDESYNNPYRRYDLTRAKKLLADAGYPGGIDPATSQPLKLTFDTGNTSTSSKLQYQFFVNQWRDLGLDVRIAATNYNQFQEKVRRGAYQIFTWGWIADYPDPENFLFLLDGASARSKSGGPNTANFDNPEYNRLYDDIKDRVNGPERLRLIREMIQVLETARPWIELHHREAYVLSHGWLKNSKPSGLFTQPYKFLDVDPEARAAARDVWNDPITWPAYLLVGLAALVILPAIRTFYRERQ